MDGLSMQASLLQSAYVSSAQTHCACSARVRGEATISSNSRSAASILSLSHCSRPFDDRRASNQRMSSECSSVSPAHRRERWTAYRASEHASHETRFGLP